jgi:tRNA(adenine34) deaminase
MLPDNDLHFMKAALMEARQAQAEDETPVGAVVVHRGRIIGRGHNQRETLRDPTAHAEMIAMTAAAAALCAGALVLARIPRLVYGATDPKACACGSLYRLHEDPRLNHRAELIAGVLEEECSSLLVEFFQRRRRDQRGAADSGTE